MNISYKWLSEYIPLSETPEELAKILTSIGLEVENIDEVEAVKGGLKGVVIGKVIECKPHPNSDHLSLTKVDLGTGELFPIVCGASNVAAGQTVAVATVGTKLNINGSEIEIKKAKIRGEESFGMICAEDELGIGKSHAGIMVLPNDIEIGTPAAKYFNLQSDYTFTIGLTPNRIDAASHIGVARDLAAYFSLIDNRKYSMPNISDFKIDRADNPVKIEVLDSDGCFRYSGITIEGVTVTESPEWLKTKLVSIGLTPINNVVDITNFILHELGQPLHAFDMKYIKGNKVVVRTLPEGTIFTTLDGVERKLNSQNLMICNAEEGMCIAGVFGGINSGITEKTTSVFLESACFNPVRIRKTARYHKLSTDASFRYERGTDPNIVITALKRAAILIKQIAGGEITSEIIDVYTNKIENFKIDFNLSNFHTFAGKIIPEDTVKTILKALEIEILGIENGIWKLNVPPYRVDVQRQADISEEILRIYGYNNIEVKEKLEASITTSPKPDSEKIQDKISDFLVGSGFSEIMNNSITKTAYFEQFDTFNTNETVKLLNPLSSDLNCMRQTLFFGALETVKHNFNHKQLKLKLFEFGNIYKLSDTQNLQTLKSYNEQLKLSLTIAGTYTEQSWNNPETYPTFFDLKAIVENIFSRMGIKQIDFVKVENLENDIISQGLTFEYQNRQLGYAGIVSRKVKKYFDLQSDMFYAELNWEQLLKINRLNRTEYVEIPKYPAVRRDLALVVDKAITFKQLKQIAEQNEKQFLKNVSLFDVYEGDKIEENKKSYAMSFILQDENKTMEDKQIEKIMRKLITAFEREVGGKLR